VWALATLFGAVAFAWRYLSFEEYGNDHFVHLSQAHQMLHGLLPVRDFVERGIPLMTAVSAAAQATWGEGLRAEVLLVCGAYALAAGLVFAVAAAVSGSRWIALLAALAPVVIFPIGYSYPKLLLYAAMLALALRHARAPGAARPWELGVLVAVGFLFRHDHGVLLLAAAAVLLAVCHGARRAGALAFGRVAVIAFVLVSPFLVWVQLYQGLGSYVAQALAFAQRESERSDGWWIPPPFTLDRDRPLWSSLVARPVVRVQWRGELAPDGVVRAEQRHGLTRVSEAGQDGWHYELRWWGSGALDALLRDPDVAAVEGIDRARLSLTVPHPVGVRAALSHLPVAGYGMRLRDNGVGVWFYLIWALPIAGMLVLWRQGGAIDPPTRAVVIVAIVLQLAMNVAMIRDPLPTRIRDVLAPAAVLMAWLAGRSLARFGSAGRAPRTIGRVAVSAALLCLVALSGAVGEASERIETMRIAEGIDGVRARLRELRRVVLPPRARFGALDAEHQPIVRYLQRCTRPQARILTMTFAPELFFYTDRLFAGGQVAVIPGYFATDADQRLMVSRLMREEVPIVVLDSETTSGLAQDYARVMGWLRPRYREAGRFRAGSDRELIVLADATRPETGRFDDTDLPCFAP
jgi:hypothetical protein